MKSISAPHCCSSSPCFKDNLGKRGKFMSYCFGYKKLANIRVAIYLLNLDNFLIFVSPANNL